MSRLATRRGAAHRDRQQRSDGRATMDHKVNGVRVAYPVIPSGSVAIEMALQHHELASELLRTLIDNK